MNNHIHTHERRQTLVIALKEQNDEVKEGKTKASAVKEGNQTFDTNMEQNESH